MKKLTKKQLEKIIKLADKEIQQWIKFKKTCLNKLKDYEEKN